MGIRGHQSQWRVSRPDGYGAGRRRIATGHDYWDGQQWVPSDPSFESLRIRLWRLGSSTKVNLNSNLNRVGASRYGPAMESHCAHRGGHRPFTMPANGRSAVIAAITDCAGVR